MIRVFALALLATSTAFADHLPPGYMFAANELETVQSLQRAGYPVKEIREEIELDIWETTPLTGDRSARALKKQTIPAKPGMFLLRSERLPCWSPGFSRSSFLQGEPSPAKAGTPTKLLLPNQPVHLGNTRPLPEHTRPPRAFNAGDLKLGRGGLAGEPMGDVTWLPDGEHWLQVKEGKLWKIAARTGRAVELFVDPKNIEKSLKDLPGIKMPTLLREIRRPVYTFDPKFEGILVRNTGSAYFAYRDGRKGVHLGDSEMSITTFSPDGKWIAFVREGNLFAVETAMGKQKQLTTDGGKNEILNGQADWVYEEEIFHRRGQAYWWSPDSKQIAFLRFDDSWVRKFALTHNNELHSEIETIRYPKSGEPNPQAKIGVVKVGDEKPAAQFLSLDGYKPEDTIISRVGWVPGEKPVPFAYLQNRTQTWLDMVKWPTVDGTPVRMLREDHGPWVMDLGEPKWFKDGTFIVLSERDGYRRIYHLDQSGKVLHRTTKGWADITSITRLDDDGSVHFSHRNGSAAGICVRSIFREGDPELKTDPHAQDDSSLSHRQTIAPRGEFYVCYGTDNATPQVTSLNKTITPGIRILDSNPCYERDRFRFGKYERTKIKTRDGFDMEAAITYPPDFDPAKKYPIWMLTYGGPNAPTIKDGWGGGRVFEQILAAHGIVVLRVDPQSASGKGMVNSKVCYKQLGVKELQDLEDAVDWIGQKPWADTKRVGLSGHSFGGFLTAFALTHSKKFSAGIAGAPVTDWRLYDSIYTERYMGLPSENKEGYDKTSVIKAAKDLHGELLIVHGLIDDNVHAQNSLQLIAALQKAGKDFEVMVYPNDRHGIAGIHYPQTQLKFILRTMGVNKKN